MECAPKNDEEQPSEGQAGARDGEAESAGPVRWRIGDLLQGGRIAIIEHAGEEYRLRLTANDKLILTK
ncbi:MAG: hemin uptake protein HemP [Methyloligella sp. ZOD6]